jgi:hypothetical protein
MAQVQTSVACLRIASEDLDPIEITRLLGATPTHTQIKGTASITASESHPQPISGDVDWRIYHDYFRPSIDIQYSPAKVAAGQLTVDVTFH